ncbi:MAG TPA: stalk domain-containing protein [Sedimentibacter sp.]|nr:zinc dependent phospholipase C family protein [Sedimentibacter sp.]HOA20359.1 stalk domain-containing protein [Sedimentibacter sp.]
MRKKTLAKVLVLIFIIISLTLTPAYAWKVKTHVYSANLILEDAADGFVELAPYGEFQVLPEYQTVLRMYPEYFRAGALGPDLMPDMLIGQTVFHPGTEYRTSGEIIQTLWHLVNELPEYRPSALEQQLDSMIHSTVSIDHVPARDDYDPGDDCLEMNNKKQAQAFMLGFMSHAAGDYFGHSYVNKWAQDSWPLLTDGISEADKRIIKRHSALEAYIDSKIPAKYQETSYNTIASPQDFIFDNMIVNGKTDLRDFIRDHRISETFGSATASPHVELFFAIRDALKQRLIDINNSSAVVKLARAPEKAYCEAWIADIDRGLGAWVKANEKAAQTMLNKDTTMTQYVDVLKEWKDEHLMLMLGYPDVANDVKNAIGDINDFIMGIVPARWQQKYKDLKMDAINYIVKESVGIDINGWIEVFNPPISVLQTNLFENGAYETINKDMANFKTCTNTDDQEFVPFKNTLTLMKLILIGKPGIDDLRRISGSDGSLSFPPYANTMTYFIRNMDIGYDWEVGSPMMGFFMWGSNDDRYKILNQIFIMDPDEVKPTFSHMTQGPIEIIPGSRSWGEVPDIYVKYNNTDQISNDIGLYSTESFTNYSSPEQHKTIARNENGDFTVTTPGKGGKYHFRIYDKNHYLLAVSDEIEVVEVTQYSSQPAGNTQAQAVGNTQDQSVEITNTQPEQTTDSNTNTTGDNNVPIGTADLSTGRIKHTWKAPGSISAAVTSEEDYSTSIFFTVDPELLNFLNMSEEEENALGISSIYHTAQIDWKLNDGPWHYTQDWDTLSEYYSYYSGIYADTFYLSGEIKDETTIFDLRNDSESDGLSDLQRKLGRALILGNDEYGEDNRLDLANNTFYFRVRLYVYYFDESNYEHGYILTPWSETITYGKVPVSSQVTASQPPQPSSVQTSPVIDHSETFDEGTVLTWPYNNPLGYRLYRSESEDELGISVTDFYVTSTSYADLNVEPNTTYYYSVKPVLKEADSFTGQDEILGEVIKRYTVTTGNIANQQAGKDFIILQIDNPNMSVNGVLNEIDPGRGTTPMIISSRSMVPIRAVVEALNGTVGWDNSTQQITLTANGNTVIMWINKYEIIVNGTIHKIDVAPTIVNGRTYVPVRFAAENLNTKVYWINTLRQAVIVN